MNEFLLYCESVINESDAPLNLKVWKAKELKFFDYCDNILKEYVINEDTENTLNIKTFQNYLKKILDNDHHALRNIDYDIWETDFIRKLKELYSYMGPLRYYLENFELHKLSEGIKHVKIFLPRYITNYVDNFPNVRNGVYQYLKESIGYDEFTTDDLEKFQKSAKVLNVIINNLMHILNGIDELEKTTQTILKWGKQGGPDLSEEKLYHTTVHASKIEKEGFQINSSKKGLGGFTDNKISTTTSLKIAKGIAIAIKQVQDLANGVVDFSGLVGWCKRIGAWDNIVSNSPELNIPIQEIGEIQTIRMINKGYIVRNKAVFNPDHDEKDTIPLKVKKINNEEVVLSYWVKDKEINDNIIFWTFRRYLSELDESGRGYDPLFAFVTLDNFRGMDTKDIGIFELEVDITNKDITFVRGMYEFRVPVESIKNIKRIG